MKYPGSYVLKKVTNLLEIISQAGGLTPSAGSRAMILRKDIDSGASGLYTPISTGTNQEVININLRTLLSGDLSINLEVKNNDTIYIPQNDFFFIIGAVKRPGTYPLEPNMTMLQAVTIAGGFSERASKKKVKVIREIESQPKTISANLNDPVESQDTIIVEESFF